MPTNIQTIINGKEVPRTRILAWEQHRTRAVLKKLGVKPAHQELPALQQQLLERKAELGPAGLMRLLDRELAVSDWVTSLIARLSRGARRFCVIELVADQGSAEKFVEWYEAVARANNERVLLGATPDHYLLHMDASGTKMEVVETTGGSPLASRFFIDMEDTASLRCPIDASFPVQFPGVARTAKGVPIGGVRHQFRNEGNGFRAKLTIEFPSLVLPSMISGHQLHLASEFGNWIEAAFQ